MEDWMDCKVIFQNGSTKGIWDPNNVVFITDSFDESILGDLSEVKVQVLKEMTVAFTDVNLIYLHYDNPSKVKFKFEKKLTPEQQEARQTRSDVEYIAMMTGVDL